MDRSQLPDYSVKIAEEYYKNNVSVFLNAFSDRCLWIGPHEGQLIQSKEALLAAFSKENHQLTFEIQNLQVIPVPVDATALDIILIYTIITHFQDGQSVAFQQRSELLWAQERFTDENGKSVKDYRIRVCHISNEHPHDTRDTIYPNHYNELAAGPDSGGLSKFSVRGLNGSFFYLSGETIEWLSSGNNHTIIHTTSGEYESVEKLPAIMKKYADTLCRIHTCYAVNPRYVASIGRFFVIMDDGTKLSIPEKKYTKTRDELAKRIAALK